VIVDIFVSAIDLLVNKYPNFFTSLHILMNSLMNKTRN